MPPSVTRKLPLDRQPTHKIMEGIVMPSHGALSKAGKVRSITGNPDGESTPSHGPRVGNRKAYRRRIILGRNAGRFGAQGGQFDPFRRRRGRRR